jgi:hypothetical protein
MCTYIYIYICKNKNINKNIKKNMYKGVSRSFWISSVARLQMSARIALAAIVAINHDKAVCQETSLR